MDAITTVTVTIFCAGVIYQCGRLSVRVEKLEAWQKRMDKEMPRISEGIARIERAVMENAP
jgi:hypothetical protein